MQTITEKAKFMAELAIENTTKAWEARSIKSAELAAECWAHAAKAAEQAEKVMKDIALSRRKKNANPNSD